MLRSVASDFLEVRSFSLSCGEAMHLLECTCAVNLHAALALPLHSNPNRAIIQGNQAVHRAFHTQRGTQEVVLSCPAFGDYAARVLPHSRH